MLTKESVQQPFWAMKIEEVMRALEAGSHGLTDNAVETRKAIFGANTIPQKSNLTPLKIALNQFRSPLILILISAGILTFFLGEWVEMGVIFSAVILNAALGFYQEQKAELALEALTSYIRTRARVRRGGTEHEIDASHLLPGDIIRVSMGDRVPADARIIFANNLEVDESVLTGESLPTAKDADEIPAGVGLSERKSMIYSGTLAVQGFADAVVTGIGSATEFGKIASLLAEKKREETPLERSIRRFTVSAGLVLAILVALLFGLGIFLGKDLSEMFLVAVAVAVAAVPEGLPVALTVILAVGVQRLAGKNGVVRRLLAAETLGSTSVILTDKTGTLTQAKMEMARVVPYGNTGEQAEKDLLRDAILNTDVAIENPNDPPRDWKMFGKALEVALIRGAAEKGILSREDKRVVVDRLPFSSQYKFSAVITHTDIHAHSVMLGAPEILLRYTDMSEEEKNILLGQIETLAYGGERVLGVITKSLAKEHRKFSREGLSEFKFKGLISFRDPLRPTAREAVRRMKEAGVRTIIVTGDHRGTAEAVARDLGLVDGKGAVLTGDDLNYLKKEELANRAGEVSVFARVTPEQKVMLAKLYQEKGEVVAVSGDGVNDAPALETADIGVAVGSGTDVAKSAADLVILDDNFETIVAAIEEGRRIMDNIRKVITYLLSSVLDELLLIGGALLFGLALPLNALQILFVNFFSESFPAVGFAFEKNIDGLGSAPRKLQKNLFDREIRFLISVIGISTSLLLFLLYAYLLRAGFSEELVRSFIFATFATYSLILVFPLRSLGKSVLEYNPFSNFYLTGGVGFGLVLTGLAIYLPFLQNVLQTVPLPPVWLVGVLAVGLANIVAVELGKWLFRSNYLRLN